MTIRAKGITIEAVIITEETDVDPIQWIEVEIETIGTIISLEEVIEVMIEIVVIDIEMKIEVIEDVKEVEIGIDIEIEDN